MGDNNNDNNSNVGNELMKELIRLIPRPDAFSGSLNDDVISWISKMELYYSSLNIVDDRIKLNIGVMNLKDRAIKWMTGLSVLNQVPTTWNQFKTELSNMFRNANAVRIARDKLDALRQLGSVSSYNERFMNLLIDIGDNMDEKERLHRYTKGLKAEQQLRVVTSNVTSLQEAMQIASQVDSILWSVKQSQQYYQHDRHYNNTTNDSVPMDIDSIQHNKSQKHNKHYNTKQNKQTSNKTKQMRLNVDKKEYERRKQHNLCLACGQSGHRIATCQQHRSINTMNVNDHSKRDNNNNSNDIDDSDDDNKLSITSISITSINNVETHVSLLKLIGTCNNIVTSMLVDSGSTGNFISQRLVKQYNMNVLQANSNYTVTVADGRTILCNTYVNGRLCIGKMIDHVRLIVAPIEHDIVLGLPWLQKHSDSIHIEYTHPINVKYKISNTSKWVELPIVGNTNNVNKHTNKLCSIDVIRQCLKQNYELYVVDIEQVNNSNVDKSIVDKQYNSSSQSAALSKLLKEYNDVFPDKLPIGLPPDRGISHTIDLEDNYKIPIVRPEYRKSSDELDWLHKEIQQGLSSGIIRPSKSPFAARVILVKKPNSNEYRVCIDYRDLNRITRKNNYGLPRQDELFDRLGNAQWFSKIDLRTGYYQIQVAEQDRYKTAFKTRYGHYEYNVMPMGLCNAPATFMHLMNNVFDDMLDKYVVVYLDDILVYSNDIKQHIQHLRNVLDRLRHNKLYGKLSKCEFLKRQVTFLGHIVGSDGIHMDPKKVKAVNDWPIPNNVHELRSFLGLAGYYRKFIHNYSNISAPLNELTKKGKVYTWSNVEQQSFDQLKYAVTHAPILIAPNINKPFIVYTDASGYGVGATLMQYNNQHQCEQPVAYYSHKLNDAERKYPVYEQELLAVKLALLEWRHYLLGNKFTIYTDHRSLTWLRTQPNLSTRQARWLDLFTEYNYDVEYVKGQHNVVADALSRRIDLKSIQYNNSSISLTDNDSQYVKQAYSNDQLAQSIITGKNKALIAYTYNNDTGYVYYNDRIYIPRQCKETINKLLYELHDSESSGHGGVHKTLSLLQKYVYWPKMKNTVQQYVKTCKVCQQDKNRTSMMNGLLQPHNVPDKRWHTISMDYIVALPDTPTGHNSILVVTDKLSKMSHFIPTNINVTAEQTAQLFIDNIFRLHGLPKKIISDRGTQFTSEFWTQLWKTLDTKLNISTAYHPQTDGQTERTNQTLESILRHYVHWNETTWDKHIAIIEFAYNNAIQVSTGYSPFYLMYGDNPQAPIDLMFSNTTSSTVVELLQHLQSELKQAQDNIRQATDKYTEHANKSRLDVTFKEGEMVLLSTKNLRVQAPEVSNKFLPKYVGPFKISKVISSVAYQLDLPETMKCHPVFHVDKLQSYHNTDNDEFPNRIQVNRPIPPIEAAAPEWIVEKIVDRCWREVGTQGKKGYKCWREWLVKWKEHNSSNNTWEKQNAFIDGSTVNEVFKQYELQHPYSKRQLVMIHKYDKNKYSI